MDFSLVLYRGFLLLHEYAAGYALTYVITTKLQSSQLNGRRP
jgi:hypothetical protein